MSKYLFFFFSLSLFGQPNLEIEQMFKAQRERFKKFDQKIEQMFKNFDSEHASLFNDSHSFSEVEKIEDSKEVKLIVLAPDLKNSNINVEVKDGYINLSGRTEKREEVKGAGLSVSSSQFSQSFPVPRGVNEDSLKTKVEGDKIYLIFEKLKNVVKKQKDQSIQRRKKKVYIPGGVKV